MAIKYKPVHLWWLIIYVAFTFVFECSHEGNVPYSLGILLFLSACCFAMVFGARLRFPAAVISVSAALLAIIFAAKIARATGQAVYELSGSYIANEIVYCFAYYSMIIPIFAAGLIFTFKLGTEGADFRVGGPELIRGILLTAAVSIADSAVMYSEFLWYDLLSAAAAPAGEDAIINLLFNIPAPVCQTVIAVANAAYTSAVFVLINKSLKTGTGKEGEMT